MTTLVFADESTTIPTKPDDYYVYDSADVINDVTGEEIALINTDNIAEYGEIIIVTITSSGDMALADYAQELFDTWEIGGSNETGALLIMDIDGDYYRSIIGAGFSSSVSESQLRDILDGQVEYYFASKDYSSAASIFVSSVMNKVIPTTTQSSTIEDDLTDDASSEDSSSEEELADDSSDETEDSSSTVTPTESEKDETSGNGFAAVLFTIFKALLIIILILLIIVVGFLILVNIRSQKNKKRRNSRRSRRNK